ncbi:hypothetical protein [Hymenobacter sp. B81]|uniref:hypothetical protein n=1 Tax=Hymenobacter sp. B81 TaxID=3344878 RepID=UPI0037DC7A82
MSKSYHRLGDWRRNTLLVAAALSLGLGTTNCGPSGRDEAGSQAAAEGDWSGETYSQGVITEMTETAPGKWKITAERPAGKEEVAAILRYQDGRVDTLQGQALQQQMQNYARTYPENRVGHSGMMDVLMWSGIGYMAGRFMMPNTGYYANPGVYQGMNGWRQQTGYERDRQGRGFFGRGFSSSARSSRTAGISESPTVRQSTMRSSSPRFGRSSGFGSRSSGFGG